ncbi:protein phosphatase 2C, putative [Trypanosoma equiperdum]|uniref:Protein phosphatase 2C, putative n=1 Tax=Trypanosoma equiperdum TaxID=5694 RepID=A0A1G4IH60_TRYEQ|nr:protein phosphatase 2C, putative [Trypanosoma equiperdum]
MGVMLPKPVLSKVVDRAGNYNIGVASACVNGYRVSMEDAHVMLVESEMSLLGIFDGHNGSGCSKYIADHLPQKVKALNGKHTQEELEKVCVSLDRDFILNQGDASGSTGTFCIVTRDYNVTICNVGDSRTIIARGGRLVFVTEDHKPTAGEERQRIEACGGCVVSGRVDGDLAVSRSFGDASFKRRDALDDYKSHKVVAVPDVTTHACRQGDIIILACDGVFEGNFSNEEVAAFVNEQASKSPDLAVAAARVCDEAIRRGSKDNVSCLIARLSDGASAARLYGAHSFLPGPPYPRMHDLSRTAYVAMAQMAQVTHADALAARYALLTAHENKTLSTKSPLEQTAFEMSDETDIEAEKNFFGWGPAPGNEAAFFRSLAEQSNK